MAYDPEGRATQASSLAAGYRGDGLRAWKESSGTKTYFLYDGGEPVVELDGSGNVTATDVYAPDGLVARGTSSGWTQYAFDPEGNVAQRLDASGNVLSSSAYDGYGNEASAGSPTDPFGYHARDGYYLDRETGLYLCQNRYYDPGTGHWLTRDPIGANGGINVYGYCGSGPVRSADPSGLAFTSLDSPGSAGALAGDENAAGIAARQARAVNSLFDWFRAPIRWLAGLLGLGATATAVDPEAPEEVENTVCSAASQVSGGGGSPFGGAAQQIQTNAQNGANAEAAVRRYLQATGNIIQQGPKQAVNTPMGRRFPDVVVTDPAGKILEYIEVKSGNAVYGGLQAAKDAWIAANGGPSTTVIYR